MEALRRDDIERAQKTAPEVKLQQTLAMMEEGIRFKRIQLRLRFPDATEAEFDERLRRWLQRDE